MDHSDSETDSQKLASARKDAERWELRFRQLEEKMEAIRVDEEKKKEEDQEIEALKRRLVELGVPGVKDLHNCKIKLEDSPETDRTIRPHQKLDFSWVTPCKGKSGFKRWSTGFERLLRTNLAHLISQQERNEAIESALTLAFMKGEFVVAQDDLSVFIKEGIRGIDLLERFRRAYQMVSVRELELAEEKFKNMSRDRQKKERLHDCLQRFDRMLAEVETLFEDGQRILDREENRVLKNLMYPSEFRDVYALCKIEALKDSSLDLGGEGVDKYSFHVIRRVAGEYALTLEATSNFKEHQTQERAKVAKTPPFKLKGKCFNCEQEGHYSNQCPNPNVEQNPPSETANLSKDKSKIHPLNNNKKKKKHFGEGQPAK